MKKLLATIAFFVTLIATIYACLGASLVWDANTEPDLQGYRLYHANGTNEFKFVAEIRNATSITLTNVPPGTNQFYLTAINTAQLESQPSNIVTANVPRAPQNFQLIVTSTGTNVTILQLQ